MDWWDFDQVYNETSASNTLAWVSKRVGCSDAPDNVLRESYTRVAPRANVSTADACTMTHVEDFPFIKDKLFQPTATTSIPVMSRREEEVQMVVGEPACSRGEHCECMKMFSADKRFIMKAMEINGEQTDLCVLCTRMEVLRLYIHARANAIIPSRMIQPYRNIVGVKGEYDMKDCIGIGPGIRDPFIFYARAHYRSVLYDGELRVIQDMSDFRQGARGE